MLRVAGRRLSYVSWRSTKTSSVFVSKNPINGVNSSSDCPKSVFLPHTFSLSSLFLKQIRGLSSDSLALVHDIGLISDLPATVAAVKNPTPKIVYADHNRERYPPGDPSKRAFAYFVLTGLSSDSLAPAHDIGLISDLPATVAAVKNPTPKIVYDDHNRERYPPGDPSKRAFAYFVLTGGRFVYASLIHLLILKLVLSMSASKGALALALASFEVDLSSVEPGTTVTVKWHGKPVFIRCRTDDDISLANSVDLNSLCDQQEDAARVNNPEWLVVLGVCIHLGCIPLPNAGDFGGWFCPCHGSHYDISGRIRKGPAPYNLEVPTYSFLEENNLLIG